MKKTTAAPRQPRHPANRGTPPTCNQKRSPTIDRQLPLNAEGLRIPKNANRHQPPSTDANRHQPTNKT
jgi:hypothetical protein